jgi:hypothetical protein
MSDKQKTPGMIIFVGVIMIIVGCWSLVGGVCGGGGIGVAAISKEPPGAQGKVQPGDVGAVHRFFAKEVPGYFAVSLAIVGIDMLFGLGQLVAGIGLLRLNSLARSAAMLLTLGKLLLSFGSHAFQIIFVLPAQERFFQLNPPVPAGQPQPFDINMVMRSLTVVILVITVVIQIAIALTVVIVLNTKNTKAAFAGQSSESSDEERERPRSRYEGYDDDDDQPPPSARSPGDTGITDHPR